MEEQDKAGDASSSDGARNPLVTDDKRKKRRKKKRATIAGVPPDRPADDGRGTPPRSPSQALNGSAQRHSPPSSDIGASGLFVPKDAEGAEAAATADEPVSPTQGKALHKLRQISRKAVATSAINRIAREHAERARRLDERWAAVHRIVRLDLWSRRVYNVLITVPILWFMIDSTHAIVKERGDPWDRSPRAEIDGCLTVLWVLDFAMGFITPYYDRHACDWIYERKAIVKHFVHTVFCPLDMLAILPYEMVWRAAAGPSVTGPWYHIPRAARALMKTVKAWWYVTPSTSFPAIGGNKTAPAMCKMTYTAFCIMVPLHLLTVVTMALHFHGQNDIGDQEYMTALYWVTYTLTSVGYGDVAVDTFLLKLWAIIVMASGTIVLGIVIALLSEYVVRKDEVQSEVEKGLQEMASLLDHYSIPSRLRTEILSFHTHYLENNVYENHEAKILRLPETMRDKISLYVRMKFIQMVPMFATVTEECHIQLAASLEQRLVDPGTLVIEVGAKGREMFFLSHGAAEVLVDTPSGPNTVVKVIKKGEFFGEIALLWDTRRTASVRTVGYCDLFTLYRIDFILIALRFREFQQAIQEELDRRQGKSPAGETVLDKLQLLRDENLTDKALVARVRKIIGSEEDAEGQDDAHSTAPAEAPAATRTVSSASPHRSQANMDDDSCGESDDPEKDWSIEDKDTGKVKIKCRPLPEYVLVTGEKRRDTVDTWTPSSRGKGRVSVCSLPGLEDDSDGEIEAPSVVKPASVGVMTSLHVTRAIRHMRKRPVISPEEQESQPDPEERERNLENLIEQSSKRLRQAQPGGWSYGAPRADSFRGGIPLSVARCESGALDSVQAMMQQILRQQSTGLRFTNARLQELAKSLNGVHERIDGLVRNQRRMLETIESLSLEKSIHEPKDRRSPAGSLSQSVRGEGTRFTPFTGSGQVKSGTSGSQVAKAVRGLGPHEGPGDSQHR
eukprot:TRINITY_DN11563_c0_g1_i1.p1 TRINITY_DN11563_c0_g1~~TRINITY_DN11563_c0_g1_i1.p1  ORF type:complete len:973 (+),score=176.80 TRINITY_DN11563_c0_g1_i1:44-2920(+)